MMCISTKGRYALRVMTFLAQWPGRPLTKTEISEAEQITPGYLQQIMGSLVGAGLVKSYRGKAGGFALACDPAAITVGEVLRCTEGKLEPVPCEDMERCSHAGTCVTRPFWMKLMSQMQAVLDGTTIADLLNEAGEPEMAPPVAETSLSGRHFDRTEWAGQNALPASSAR